MKAAHLNPFTSTVPTWTTSVVPGSVLSQSVPANTSVPAGTKVRLVLLQSGGTYPVPNVVDMPAINAAATLAKYGLSPGQQSSACSPSTFSGNVASTSPLAGTLVMQGTTVNLTISSGQCPVKVPDVIGLNLQMASASLTSMQLNPVPVTSCPVGDVQTSTVTSQNPLPATPVRPGSPVTITFCAPQGNSGTTGNSGAAGIVQGRHGRAHGHDRHHHERTR
jgi:serine/threonine-protein kinase